MSLVTRLISQNMSDLGKTMLHHSSPLLFPRTCGTYGMVYHAIGHQVLFTQTIPWEPIDFTRGDKGSKHVPLPTYIFFCNQKVLVGRFYLCVRLCQKTMYQPLAGFDALFFLNSSLIALLGVFSRVLNVFASKKCLLKTTRQNSLQKNVKQNSVITSISWCFLLKLSY